MVLLELDGNPGGTFKLKRNLQQLQPQALRVHIYKHASLPESWNRKYVRGSHLALSIGDAAVSDGMNLHQNGQCCPPDSCDPLSLSARVCSGVTDGTVITVTLMMEQAMQAERAEQFYRIGCSRVGGAFVDGQHYTREQCYIKALELNGQYAQAWSSLGFEGGGSVGGQHYTKRQCMDKSRKLRAAA